MNTTTLVNLANFWLNPIIATGCYIFLMLLSGHTITTVTAVTPAFIFVLTLVLLRDNVLGTSVFDIVSTKKSNTLLPLSALCGAVLLLDLLTNNEFRVSKNVTLMWIFGLPIITVVCHLSVSYFLRKRYKGEKDNTLPRAAIIGGNHVGNRLSRELQNNPLMGKRFVGFFDDRPIERLDNIAAERLLGTAKDAVRYAREGKIDVVYVALPIAAQVRIFDLIEALQDTTVSVYFLPDIQIFDLIEARFDTLNGIPIVALCQTPFYGLNAIKKRLTDIVLSVIALVVLSPLMLAVVIAIKLTSPGPIIFTQQRYGLGGDIINVYKFRSMYFRPDEDKTTVKQATKDDPRTTPIGRILRRSSIDELPQLFNVLKGDMSLIGPRPHAVAHNEEYRKKIKGYMLRHKTKPGISGWAQVNGLRGEIRNDADIQDRIDYDLDYLRCWSLSFDFWIMFRSLWVIIVGNNAY